MSPALPRLLAAAALAFSLSPACQAMEPLAESELAASHAAGLDAALLRGLQAGAGLPLPVPDLAAASAAAPGSTSQLAEAGLQRQAAQWHQQAAVVGSQLALGSAVLGASLVFAPALPLMLPVIGLPFLGLLPMLPPPKKS